MTATIKQHQVNDALGRHLNLVRGHPLPCTDQPPVLLLHGSTLPGSLAYTLAFDGRSWIGDLAARGRDAWALDVRGYGGSWKPADDGARPCAPVADTDQAVDDVAAAITYLCESTGARSVDLVGWSWGATVAAELAARRAAPVRRLVLHAPQWLRDTPSPMVNAQSMNEPYRPVDAAAFVSRWLDRVPQDQRAILTTWRGMLETALADAAPISVPNGSARDIAVQWMAGNPAYSPADIVVPTLVVVGAADTDTPPTLARTVFDRLGSVEKLYVEIPRGTHFTVFEPARDTLFQTCAAFLAAPSARQEIAA